jgi:hypothetical protein
MTTVLDTTFLLADVRALVAEPAQPGHGDDDAAVRDRLVHLAERATRMRLTPPSAWP